ncbi:hypothetical protein [Natrinema sp. CGMCC1.2065]|uniref:hypothetical protein n=1 Tax=Natrinema sp. CGMCC1.2065 TaxID=3445767 RepID=UPI003F4A6FF6
MDASDLVQVLLLWYVVRIALDMTHLSGTMGAVSDVVGLALFFFLLLYIAKGVVEVIGDASNV